MAMRLSGLASGMDTESIVKELMAAHTLKKQKVEKKQTKLEWKKEKWQDLNTKLYNLYTKKLSALRFTSAYNTKKVTATQTDKVDIKALSSAVEGTHTVIVNKLASSAQLNSGKFDKDVTGTTKLSELGIAEGTQFKVKVGTNEEKIITIDSSTTMDSFASELKGLGLNANFDNSQKRFFISSKSSGLENDFSITATDGQTAHGQWVVDVKNYNAALKEQEAAKSAWTKAYGEDDAATVKASKLEEFYNVFESGLSSEKTVSLDNNDKDKIKEQLSVIMDKDSTDEAKSAAKSVLVSLVEDKNTNSYTPEDAEKFVDSIVKSYESNITTIDKMDERIKNADTAVEDTASRLTFSAEDGSIIEVPEDPSDYTDNASVIGLLKLTGEDSNKVAASDSEIIYNGAKLTSSSNTITVNGIEITAKDITDGEAKLTVSKDIDAVYDQIKDFIKEYNSILEEMNKLYSAKPAKGYEPLTDDEKGAMSDSQVEKWESLIQGSLFRRDSTLGGIINSMKSALSSSVKVNDKNYSLINFGISTSTNYTEGGLLHIFGDKEDATFADKDDKLRAALQDDPDTVVAALSGIMSNLYSEMSKKMASSTLSSALTFYNDKSINKELDSYKDQVSKMEKKLTRMEDNYYKRFTAMEKALSRINNQNSQLSSMLGMGAQ